MPARLPVRRQRLKPISGTDPDSLPRWVTTRTLLRLAHPGAATPKPRPRHFFKRFTQLLEWRLEYDPRHLGQADWILYGRNLNPHRAPSWNFKHYERGYAESQAQMPLRSHPLTHAPYRKG